VRREISLYGAPRQIALRFALAQQMDDEGGPWQTRPAIGHGRGRLHDGIGSMRHRANRRSRRGDGNEEAGTGHTPGAGHAACAAYASNTARHYWFTSHRPFADRANLAIPHGKAMVNA
jgi:hypothetical protein